MSADLFATKSPHLAGDYAVVWNMSLLRALWILSREEKEEKESTPIDNFLRRVVSSSQTTAEDGTQAIKNLVKKEEETVKFEEGLSEATNPRQEEDVILKRDRKIIRPELIRESICDILKDELIYAFGKIETRLSLNKNSK